MAHPFRDQARMGREARITKFGGGPPPMADDGLDAMPPSAPPPMPKPLPMKKGRGKLTPPRPRPPMRQAFADGGAAMDGAPAKKRLDRSSRAPQVNIVIQEKPDTPPALPPMPGPLAGGRPPMGGGSPFGGGAGGPPPGAAPPGGPPPGIGAGPPPGAGPPAIPGASGGTMAPALAANPMLRQALLGARPGLAGGPPAMKTGGGISNQTAGAGSGEGRKEKIRYRRQQ